jgi:hypothetical protein
VHTGFRDEKSVEITDGVTADAAVILAGKQALNDGQAVSPAKPQ